MLPLLLLLSCTSAPTPQIRHTNVVWVVLDTLRADHLGAYGYSLPTSPNFDALAERGVLFETAYANAAWTRPSMASMLTGRYPRSTGIYEERFDVLDESLWTAAERFDSRGYLTIGQTANPNINRRYGFDQGFDHWRDSGTGWRFSPGGPHQNMERGSIVNEQTQVALDHLQAELREGPFFLFTVFIDPHAPYDPPAERKAAMSAAGSEHPPYDGEVQEVDHQLGRFLEDLDRRGLMEDTLLIVTADHGEGLQSYRGVPDSQQHGPYLHDAVTRVPLLLVHPSLTPRRVPGLVSLVDLLPTVMDLLGDPLPPTQHEGTSRTDLIAGAPGGADWVFLETDWREYRKSGVRSATHKLVLNHDAVDLVRGIHERATLPDKTRSALELAPPLQLHAVGSDERTSLQVEDESAVLQSHQRALEAWNETYVRRPPKMRDPDDITTTPDGPLPPFGETGRPTEDKRLQEQLRALGYAD